MRLGLLAGLGTTNRTDTVLVFLPALAFYWFKEQRHIRGVVTIFLGFTPFLLWELFSILYYGFPFPNTAYAKLNTGILQVDLLTQGKSYFINSLQWDPITLFAILLSGFISIIKPDPLNRSMVAGIGLYLLYVLSIGGDFMSGRFFSGAILLGVALFTTQLTTMQRTPTKLILAGVVLTVGIINPASPLTYFWTHAPENPWSAIDASGQITDERYFYLSGTGLFEMDGSTEMPNHSWALRGKAYKLEGKKVIIEDNIGMVGYFTGPDVHIIDINAISDPLLARLKISGDNWQIGHFARDIPEGYIKTIIKNENKIEDDCLAEYYEKLAMVIKGPIFSKTRLYVIWQINTGQYDYLLECYESLHKYDSGS